ncbi:putative kynurenine formamidase [Candida maltosa Xu316]|uniref:Putative kynurenine formamidase n=1 Tax=Candida maltosa (strain Xu316) TaxID=1245528 RepID=M3K5D7_CANMX|nr:putative kynurenine formamidase [Candida maltosa Xu316]
MILQLLHFRKIIELGLKYSEQKEDVQELFDEIESKVVFTKVIFLDGIYDVVELLNEYPDYASFVNDAFVSSDHIKHATQLSFNYREPFSLVTTKTQFLIYQSLQDELLSIKQTQLFVSYLANMNLGFSLHTGNWGEHEDIYGKDRKVIFNGDVPTE